MKVALYTIGVLSLVAFLFSQSGCSTEQPGATDTLGTYSVNIDSSPDKVTDAANKACEDLKLSDINSNGSKVDGRVVARTGVRGWRALCRRRIGATAGRAQIAETRVIPSAVRSVD